MNLYSPPPLFPQLVILLQSKGLWKTFIFHKLRNNFSIRSLSPSLLFFFISKPVSAWKRSCICSSVECKAGTKRMASLLAKEDCLLNMIEFELDGREFLWIRKIVFLFSIYNRLDSHFFVFFLFKLLLECEK